jgi:hypothetical protein
MSEMTLRRGVVALVGALALAAGPLAGVGTAEPKSTGGSAPTGCQRENGTQADPGSVETTTLKTVFRGRVVRTTKTRAICGEDGTWHAISIKVT